MTDQVPGGMRVPEIMTSISIPEALVKALFESVRRVEDGQTRHQQLLMDARERLIRMENTDHSVTIIAMNSNITELENRIQTLEDERRERVGMSKLLDIFIKFGPWIVVLIGALISILLSEKV